MPCAETDRRLHAYFDGELDALGAAAFEEHLQSCAECRAALQDLKTMRSALRAELPYERAPAALTARISAALDRETSAPARGRSGQSFGRGLLTAMRKGGTVGILMDTNMTPPQGVFVDFFGIPTCTASGLARIALRTDAAVVPGFTVWDKKRRKYILRFEPAVELIRTEDNEEDIIANTAKFTKVIEAFIRQYPDQWLWVHRRWKTRPPGENPLY